jgi:hypothetical protein
VEIVCGLAIVPDIDGDVLGVTSKKALQVLQHVDWMIRAIVVLASQYRSCLLIFDANQLHVLIDPELTLNTEVESSMQCAELLDG